ncbi:MAG: hypothetical protein Q9187_004048 [Circinaria calcarea]
MASSTTNQRTFPNLGRFLLGRWRNAADTIKENWGFDIATNEDPVPDLRAPGTDSHVGLSAIQDLKALSIKYRGCGRAVIAALRAQAEQRQGKKLTAGQRPNRWITPSDIKAAKEGFGDRVFPRGNYGDDTASTGAAEKSSLHPKAATIPDFIPSAAQYAHPAGNAKNASTEREAATIPDSIPVAAHYAVGRLNYRVGQFLQTARTLQTKCGTYFQAGQISAYRAISIAAATLNIIETLDRLAQDIAPEGPTYQQRGFEADLGAQPLETDRSFETDILEVFGIMEQQGLQREGALVDFQTLLRDIHLSHQQAIRNWTP